MIYKKIVSALVLAGVVASPTIAFANDSSELEELRNLVQELNQKVKVLERKGEIAEEDTAAAKKETPVVKASKDGFGIQSADGSFKVNVGGTLQVDGRGFSSVNGLANDGKNISGIEARSIRPAVYGTLYDIYDFRFAPEFGDSKTANATNGSGIEDAYIDARFQPWFQVKAGKFKPYVGLERLQDETVIKFIERSYVSNNIVPNRDLGAAIHGDILDNKVNYAVGIYNGVVDGGDTNTSHDTNQGKDFEARVFTTPFKGSDNALAGLGFGIAATHEDFRGSNSVTGLPTGYLTPGQQSTFFAYTTGSVFSNGSRDRVSPQAYYYYGPFGLIAEYAQVSQDVANTGGKTATLDNDAWQVAVSYLLTGEDASFGKVKPNSPFSSNGGGWGAWDLVARYQENNIDSGAFSTGSTAAATRFADPRINARSAKSWAAGVNWYLNQNVRLALDVEDTSFDGGGNVTAAGAATGSFINIANRPDEKTLFTRLQLAF